ncbi:hypothetical protein NMY22_g8541 [Coprinellus aureogranulatus]|nr:hypothetical protein NMY22_g8541 [Coprinellus aureogranulatus]
MPSFSTFSDTQSKCRKLPSLGKHQKSSNRPTSEMHIWYSGKSREAEAMTPRRKTPELNSYGVDTWPRGPEDSDPDYSNVLALNVDRPCALGLHRRDKMSDPSGRPSYTDEELKAAGISMEDDSPAASLVELLRKHPEVARPSLSALQRMNEDHNRRQNHEQLEECWAPAPTTSTRPPLEPDATRAEPASDSPYAPSEYERVWYYYGISGKQGGQPELIYRSDFLTTPFPKPRGESTTIPFKLVRCSLGTPLGRIWNGDAGLLVISLLKEKQVKWRTLNAVRFRTQLEESDDEGTTGPAVVWIGVKPGSISADRAHDVSQYILAHLLERGVDDAVVEWCGVNAVERL